MDLASEATRLRLDALAVDLSRALDAAGVPHALLKGPSTSLWLYDPPRRYHDVDLLVPLSLAEHAAAALERAGLAGTASRVGEEAPHSLLLHSTDGFEVDLHVSLPTLPVDGDAVWTALAPHVEPFTMDVGTLPALDEVGRCLVLALHALGSPYREQPAEDLRRAVAVSGPDTWDAVAAVAQVLGASDLVAGGLARVDGDHGDLSPRARLYAVGVPPAAHGLQRLHDTPVRRRPAMVWREAFPSRGFMAYDTGDADIHGLGLVRAHLRRWRRIARQLPAAVRLRRST